MRYAKILDCTLRDGAYLIDKRFGDNAIHGIIKGLMKAKTDFIEIGFFQDEGFGEGKTVFKNSKDASRFIPKDKQGVEFTVLADCSRYSVSNLDDCDKSSVDAVRECFFKQELEQALENCRVIKEKGYKVFVQPVDILGYTDMEILDLIERLNQIEPYCLSIVDTFGSMYLDDLHRVFSLIDHNLIQTCKIGFHSHNNMQMSSALSQEFLKAAFGKREVVVDATINGMGRGAGNTPTELVMQYMVQKLNYSYDMDALLDVIDNYMGSIKSRCSWGYTTPYFIAGCYSAHVNNIAYLTQKNSIRSKDIRYILNKIGAVERKRYHYELLEQTYMEYLDSEMDDSSSMKTLVQLFSGRNVLIIVPGKTAVSCQEQIKAYAKKKNTVTVAINFLPDGIVSDYVYFNNAKRYDYWNSSGAIDEVKKIVTSNINCSTENALVVNFSRLIKCGWIHVDNSTLMFLRLLDEIPVKSIGIAGFDGYEYLGKGGNYAKKEMETDNVSQEAVELNKEIAEMLVDYKKTRKRNHPIIFITHSRFSGIF